jgi:hypothetical protein
MVRADTSDDSGTIIRLAEKSAAFVDAQLVQYGSIVVKTMIPVVLLLKKEGDVWKIASWRTGACPTPLTSLE